MTYEELVKRLREHNGWALNETLDEAANAIEELKKDLERSKEYEAFWQHEAEEALKKFQVAISNKPKWIPVTERLPEEAGMYLVYVHEPLDKDRVLVEYDMSFVDYLQFDKQQGVWQNGQYDAYNAHIDSVDKVHGYYISHWMPLPEPPKEGTE